MVSARELIERGVPLNRIQAVQDAYSISSESGKESEYVAKSEVTAGKAVSTPETRAYFGEGQTQAQITPRYVTVAQAPPQLQAKQSVVQTAMQKSRKLVPSPSSRLGEVLITAFPMTLKEPEWKQQIERKRMQSMTDEAASNVYVHEQIIGKKPEPVYGEPTTTKTATSVDRLQVFGEDMAKRREEILKRTGIETPYGITLTPVGSKYFRYAGTAGIMTLGGLASIAGGYMATSRINYEKLRTGGYSYKQAAVIGAISSLQTTTYKAAEGTVSYGVEVATGKAPIEEAIIQVVGLKAFGKLGKLAGRAAEPIKPFVFRTIEAGLPDARLFKPIENIKVKVSGGIKVSKTLREYAAEQKRLNEIDLAKAIEEKTYEKYREKLRKGYSLSGSPLQATSAKGLDITFLPEQTIKVSPVLRAVREGYIKEAARKAGEAKKGTVFRNRGGTDILQGEPFKVVKGKIVERKYPLFEEGEPFASGLIITKQQFRRWLARRQPIQIQKEIIREGTKVKPITKTKFEPLTKFPKLTRALSPMAGIVLGGYSTQAKRGTSTMPLSIFAPFKATSQARKTKQSTVFKQVFKLGTVQGEAQVFKQATSQTQDLGRALSVGLTTGFAFGLSRTLQETTYRPPPRIPDGGGGGGNYYGIRKFFSSPTPKYKPSELGTFMKPIKKRKGGITGLEIRPVIGRR